MDEFLSYVDVRVSIGRFILALLLSRALFAPAIFLVRAQGATALFTFGLLLHTPPPKPVSGSIVSRLFAYTLRVCTLVRCLDEI
jgi:hypothetical protein